MSLNLTIINPFGLWQCSDHRLVNTATGRVEDDAAIKQVHLRCRDGAALINYAGIGKLQGVEVSDWIREILRGEGRTVDESLIFLRENATRDLGPYLGAKRMHHMFSVAAVLGGQTWVAQIRNFKPTPSDPWGDPTGEFQTAATKVSAGFAACFPPLVSSQDAQLLMRVATRRPRDPEHFSNLLAAINRRVASGPAKKVVSTHCVTSFIPLAGEPVTTKFHDPAGGKRRPMIVPTLLFGIDTSEMVKNLMSLVPGQGAPANNLDQAGNLAVTPVNRLRPTPLIPPKP